MACGPEADPWAAYFSDREGPGAPAADPYWSPKKAEPLDRLAFMPASSPGAAPEGYCDPESLEGFLDDFHGYLSKNLFEKLEDSTCCVLVADSEAFAADPEWMYLKGSDERAHIELFGWALLVTCDLGCDEPSTRAFKALAKTVPEEAPHGYMEACRILAHMLKDKERSMDDLREPRRQHLGQDWSAYLLHSCSEAMEALDNPAEVRGLPKRSRSWSAHETYLPSPPGPSGSSASSRPWQGNGTFKGEGPGKDRGKGKGPGKCHQGQRRRTSRTC